MSKQLENNNKLCVSCKECVFAECEGITQIGCSMHMLDKIDNFPAYDDTREFFVVSKPCPYYRTNAWKHAANPDRAQLVRKELNIGYSVIINCPTNDLASAAKTLKSIMQQTKKPSMVEIFYGPSSNNGLVLYQEILRLSEFNELNTKLNLFSRETHLTEREQVSIHMRKLKGESIFIYIDAGNEIEDTELMQRTEDNIFDNQFEFICMDVDGGFVAPNSCYSYFLYDAKPEINSYLDYVEKADIL